MQRKTMTKILMAIVIVILIIMSSSNSFAGITPDQITGREESISIDLGFIDDVANLIRFVGTFIAVGALMIIGIRYVMGSIEEKANYKKSMMPYIVGCFILFGASYIAPEIRNAFSEVATDAESVGNAVLGIIQVVGTFIAVGVLMVLGIKYMVGSVEERASYKKSMVPYLIGSVLIFAAVNITGVVYDMTMTTQQTPYARGQAEAQSMVRGKTQAEVYDMWQEAIQNYQEAEATGEDVSYYRGIMNYYYDLLKDTYL